MLKILSVFNVDFEFRLFVWGNICIKIPISFFVVFLMFFISDVSCLLYYVYMISVYDKIIPCECSPVSAPISRHCVVGRCAYVRVASIRTMCVLFVSLKTINVYHTTDYLLALAPSIFMRCALDPDDAGAARVICASSLISSSSPSSHSSGGLRHCSFRLCISVGVARLVMLGLQLGDEVHLGLERHC